MSNAGWRLSARTPHETRAKRSEIQGQPHTDFTAAGVLGLLNSLEAVEATRADVCSLGVFLVAKMDTFQSSRARKWQAP